MVRKNIYLLAVFITIIIIIAIIATSWYFLYLKEQEINEMLLSIQTSIETSNLELLYISEYSKDGCEIISQTRSEIIKKLFEVNKKLVEAERERRIFSPTENKRLKTEQSLLYIKYWLLTMKVREKCNIPINTILYFWSADSDECKSQGYVLDSITTEYKDRVLVVPLDYNFDLGIIKIIAHEFNVTKTPTIIINEKIKFEGLVSKSEIEKNMNI